MNFLALKSILGNSKRSLHVVIAVALAVAIIYSSFTVAKGFIERVEYMSEGYALTDLIYIIKRGSSLSESSVSKNVIQQLSGSYHSSGTVLCELESHGYTLDLWGVTLDDFTEVWRPRIVGDTPTNRYEVLVGVSLSEAYGINIDTFIEATHGSKEYKFMVTGIITTNSQYDNGLITKQETVSTLRPDQDGFSFIEIKSSEVTEFLRVNDLSTHGYVLVQSRAMQDYITGLSQEIRRDIYLVSFIVAFLALVSVSHTLYKIMSDSVYEFLLLRSLGLNKKGVLGIIITDSIILSISGAIIGLILGNLISNTASIFSFLILRTVFLPVRYDANLFLFCLLIALTIGILGGVISAIFIRPNRDVYGALNPI